MTAALKYLSKKTNEIFETRMQSAARKINRRGRLFCRRTTSR